MRTLQFLSIPALVVITVAACSSTSSNASDACARLFDSYSGVLTKCGDTSSDFAPSARANFIKACTNSAAAPGSGLGPAFIDACTASLQSAGCTDLDDVPACQEPAGTLADGAGCADGSQCASTRCSVGSNSGSSSGAPADAGATAKPGYCGVCVPSLAEGAACGSSSSSSSAPSCARGLQCRDGKCQKKVTVAEGQSCVQGDGSNSSSTLSCVSGTFCDTKITNGKLEGTCKKLPSTGEPCTTRCATGAACVAGKCVEQKDVGGDCLSNGECKTSLKCGATKKCEAAVKAGLDAACGSIDDASSASVACADGLACINNGTSNKGTCKARIAEGAACETNKPGAVPCERYLTCIEGTCQFEDANRCN